MARYYLQYFSNFDPTFLIIKYTFWICPEDQFGATSGKAVAFVEFR
jgi:hypothetical protein